MATLPALPTRPNPRTTPHTYRLTPDDMAAVRRIRDTEKLRTDTEAIRLALREAAKKRKPARG